MSYDIFYNKQFVQLRRTGEVIPMFLAGSNNCYDIGIGGRNGRRARDWSPMAYYNGKGKLSEKPTVMLKNLDADLRKTIRKHNGSTQGYDKTKPSEIRDHFGYYSSIVVGSGHCADTSWDKWRVQFSNGIKHALTIEQLNELGVNLHFDAFSGSPDGQPPVVALKTERDYFTELKKWREWRDKNSHSFSLGFFPLNDDAVLKRLREPKRKAPRAKQQVEQDHYFVLANGSICLARYTSRGYRYTEFPSSARRFPTEEEAEARRQRLVKEQRYKADQWTVKRIDSHATFYI